MSKLDNDSITALAQKGKTKNSKICISAKKNVFLQKLKKNKKCTRH